MMFKVKTAKGVMSEHSNCIDCGINTHPGAQTREQVDEMLRAGALRAEPDKLGMVTYDENTEVYMVRDKVWKQAGMEPYGGCLCISCLEKRIGRKLWGGGRLVPRGTGLASSSWPT